jgi:hypothetical protein
VKGFASQISVGRLLGFESFTWCEVVFLWKFWDKIYFSLAGFSYITMKNLVLSKLFTDGATLV